MNMVKYHLQSESIRGYYRLFVTFFVPEKVRWLSFFVCNLVWPNDNLLSELYKVTADRISIRLAKHKVDGGQ